MEATRFGIMVIVLHLQKKTMIISFKVSLFNTQCVFIFGGENLEYSKIRKVVDKRTDSDDIKKYLLDIKSHNDKKGGTTMDYEDGTYWAVIYKWDNTAYDYSILQHEIFHVADLMLRKRGFVLSDDSEEAWAYLIQEITLNVYGKLW